MVFLKFVDQVGEITFSGKETIKAGKNVFYINDVGDFQLTAKFMMLIELLAGVNLQKDVLDAGVIQKVREEVNQAVTKLFI